MMQPSVINFLRTKVNALEIWSLHHKPLNSSINTIALLIQSHQTTTTLNNLVHSEHRVDVLISFFYMKFVEQLESWLKVS